MQNLTGNSIAQKQGSIRVNMTELQGQSSK